MRKEKSDADYGYAYGDAKSYADNQAKILRRNFLEQVLVMNPCEEGFHFFSPWHELSPV